VTLLLVEETAAMRRLIRSLIDGLPVSIVECRHRRDVMPLCRALQPDWVVVDLDLASGDALTAVREIHRSHPAVGIAVLGEDSARLREAAERAGARVYLAKEHLVELPRLLRAERP
jgi:CheY-like chemotaxis protein